MKRVAPDLQVWGFQSYNNLKLGTQHLYSNKMYIMYGHATCATLNMQQLRSEGRVYMREERGEICHAQQDCEGDF
jgi:hypothetical protein